MTPNLDEIRRTLAAKKPSRDGATLMRNAPTWLASLCDEIERLRAELSRWDGIDWEEINRAVAERDAALAEAERLRNAYDVLL